MSLFSHHCQLTEIFVEGVKNATILIGQGQDFIIPVISRPVSRPEDIVPCGLQRRNSPK